MNTKKLQWREIAFPIPRSQWPQGVSNVHGYLGSNGLRVTESTDRFPGDSRTWLHLAVSREDRYPSWDDLLLVKEEFIGDEAEAYQVLPRKSEYVNIHPNCFHLWHCVDGQVMPA